MFFISKQNIIKQTNQIKCLNTWEEFCAQDSSAQDSSAQETLEAIIIQHPYINPETASTL
jgi:hypothetical protein